MRYAMLLVIPNWLHVNGPSILGVLCCMIVMSYELSSMASVHCFILATHGRVMLCLEVAFGVPQQFSGNAHVQQ